MIASVRSTPLCTAIRNNVAPAIAALLDNDTIMDKSVLAFDAIHKHALLDNPAFAPDQWRFIDLGHLTYLIGPMTDNLKKIDDLLADPKTFASNPSTADDRQLAQIKDELGVIEAQQKVALNVVSGYDSTALLRNFFADGPVGWASAIGIQTNSPSAAFFNRATLSDSQWSGGRNQRFLHPLYSPGRFDESLAYNSFRVYSDAITAAHSKGATAEATAAATIAPIASYCLTK